MSGREINVKIFKRVVLIFINYLMSTYSIVISIDVFYFRHDRPVGCLKCKENFVNWFSGSPPFSVSSFGPSLNSLLQFMAYEGSPTHFSLCSYCNNFYFFLFPHARITWRWTSKFNTVKKNGSR